MAHFDTIFPVDHFGKRPVVILDGGMGTTLQSPPFTCAAALDSLLWSSELLKTEDGCSELRKLHQTWVDAGAEVLGSCTYQSSLPLFLPSQESFTSEDIKEALKAMLSALPIITLPYTPLLNSRTTPHAALSLGPFGAQLTPAQEYSGLYPAPFGEASTSKLAYSEASGQAVPLPLERVGVTDNREEDHLAAWHLLRLKQFQKSEAFEKLSMIAFETVPNLYEARAIRRAMAAFSDDHQCGKSWYISYVFPLNKDGEPKLPDKGSRQLGLADQLDLIVKSTFGPSKDVATRYATPSGFGINCTSPFHLQAIVEALTASIQTAQLSFNPWLVLYPDGGSVYDVVTRTWSNPNGLNDTIWAQALAAVVAQALAATNEGVEPLFGGVICGGCCKAGPSAIRELRKVCEDKGWLKRL